MTNSGGASKKIEINEVLRDDTTTEPLHMVVDDRLRWDNGQTIRIKFLNGSLELQDNVKRIIGVWQPHVNLAFKFVTDGDSDIRISFDRGLGSFSFIGKAAQGHDCTMNLFVTAYMHQQELEHQVLHEFGHALGCVHEHASPVCPIIWDTDKVYSHYDVRYGWGRDKVDRNVLQKAKPDTVRFSNFDPDSIMMYALKPDLTQNSFSTQDNPTLSKTDKKFISEVYPKLKGDQVSSPDPSDVPRYQAAYGLAEQVRSWF